MAFPLFWIGNILCFVGGRRNSGIDLMLGTTIVTALARESGREQPPGEASSPPAGHAPVARASAPREVAPLAVASPPAPPAPPAPEKSIAAAPSERAVARALELFSREEVEPAVAVLTGCQDVCGSSTPRQVIQLLLLMHQYGGDRIRFERCSGLYEATFQQKWPAWQQSHVGQVPKKLAAVLVQRGLPVPGLRTNVSAAPAAPAPPAPLTAPPEKVADAKAQVAAEVASKTFDAA